ncbi:hypothetical protein CIB48_g1526 [Xylaria polymorpha]|nr:hypothetical protein CIB48_g1526 [Xylaria polymorpha]
MARKRDTRLDLACIRIRDDEDGVENGGQVDGVDGTRELRGDDGALAREAVRGLLRERPTLHTVELQVHPPDAGDAQHRPQIELPHELWEREVVQDEEVGRAVYDQQREPDGKDPCADKVGQDRCWCRGREEGRYTRAWKRRMLLSAWGHGDLGIESLVKITYLYLGTDYTSP